MHKLIVLLAVLIAGCVTRPDNVTPVTKFDSARYLGTWYEIARLDHSFERGLSQVSASYSLRADGGIKVINRGYDGEKKQWKQAEGKAYFVGPQDQGFLKVSFFGPFYGSYIVFELDQKNYSYSLVSGPDKSYFWLLSRTPTMDAATKAMLLAKAGKRGFDISKLIHVAQPAPR